MKSNTVGETKHKSLKETNAEKHLSTIFISKGEVPMPARITPKRTQAIRSRLWYMNMPTKATQHSGGNEKTPEKETEHRVTKEIQSTKRNNYV